MTVFSSGEPEIVLANSGVQLAQECEKFYVSGDWRAPYGTQKFWISQFSNICNHVQADGLSYYYHVTPGQLSEYVERQIMFSHAMGDAAWDETHYQTKQIPVDDSSIIGYMACEGAVGPKETSPFLKAWNIPDVGALPGLLPQRSKEIARRGFEPGSMLLFSQSRPGEGLVRMLQFVREKRPQQSPKAFTWEERAVVEMYARLLLGSLQVFEEITGQLNPDLTKLRAAHLEEENKKLRSQIQEFHGVINQISEAVHQYIKPPDNNPTKRL